MAIDPYRRPETPRSPNYSNPLAPRGRRSIAGMIARDQADFANQQEDAARAMQRDQEEARKMQEKAAEDAAKAQREADDRKTRELAAAGAETTTDIETGRRTVATHEDGKPKWKPGPLGEPAQVGGKWTQKFRNDRGEETEADIANDPNLHKVDEKTGEKYFEGKDAFGKTTKISLGYDEEKKKKVEMDQRFTREKAGMAVERERLNVDAQALDNEAMPITRERDDLDRVMGEHKKGLSALGLPANVEIDRTADGGKLGYRHSSGVVIPFDDTKAAQVGEWKKRQDELLKRDEETQARFRVVQERKDALRKQQNDLQIRESKLEIERAKLEYPGIDESVLAPMARPENAPAIAETNAKISDAVVNKTPESVADLRNHPRPEAREAGALAMAASPLSVRSQILLVDMTPEQRAAYEPALKDFEANEGAVLESKKTQFESISGKMRPALDALGETEEGKSKFGDLQMLELLTGKVKRNEEGAMILPDEAALKARMDANPEFWNEQRKGTAMKALQRVKNAGQVIAATYPAYKQAHGELVAAQKTAQDAFTAKWTQAGIAADNNFLESLIGKPVNVQQAQGEERPRLAEFGGTVVPTANGFDIIGADGWTDASARVDEKGFAKLTASRRQNAAKLVSPAAKSGTPFFLQANQKAATRDEFDAMLKDALQTARIASAGQDTVLKTGYEADPKQSAVSELIQARGLDVESLVKKVGNGTLSVQQGNALLTAVHGKTIADIFPDTDRMGTEEHFREFLRTRPDLLEDISGLGANKAKKDQLIDAYVSRLAQNNAGNPFLPPSVRKELRIAMQSKTTDNFWSVTVPETAAQAIASTAGIAVGLGHLLWTGNKALWGEDLTDEEKKRATLVFAQTKTSQEVLRRNISNIGEGKDNGLNSLGVAARVLDGRENHDLTPEMEEEVKTLLAKAAREAVEGKMGIGEVGNVEDYDLWNNVTGRALLDEYMATGSDSAFANMQRFLTKNEEMRLVEDAAQNWISSKATAKGMNQKMQQAFFGGSVAPLQEFGTEIIGDALMFVGVGISAKTAQTAMKVETTRKAAQRAVSMAQKIREGVNKARAATYFRVAPGKPLTALQKAANVAQAVGRGALKGGGVEGFEEMLAVTFSEVNPDSADFAKSFQEGFIGGVALAGGMGGVMAPIQMGMQESANRRNTQAEAQANQKFADFYNENIARGDASLAITPELAEPARIVIGQAAPRFSNLSARLKSLQEVAGDESRPIEDRIKAAALAGRTSTQLSTLENATSAKIHLAVEAAREIEGSPMGGAYRAVLKLASGANFTEADNAALGKLTLEGGSPVVEVVESINAKGERIQEWKVTDAARAQIAMEAPMLGQLIQTAESSKLVEAKLEASAREAAGLPQVQASELPQPAESAPGVTPAPSGTVARVTMAQAMQAGPQAVQEEIALRIKEKFPNLEANGIQVVVSPHNSITGPVGPDGVAPVYGVGGGMNFAAINGKPAISIHPAVVSNLQGFTPEEMEKWVETAIEEEADHAATEDALWQMHQQQGGTAETWAAFKDGKIKTMAAEIKAADPKLYENSAKAYHGKFKDGKQNVEWDTDHRAVMEIVRAAMQKRRNGVTTEEIIHAHVKTPGFQAFLRSVLDAFDRLFGTNLAEKAPVTAGVMDATEARLQTYEQKPTTAQDNGQNVEKQGPEQSQEAPQPPQAGVEPGQAGGVEQQAAPPQAEAVTPPEVSNDTPAAVQLSPDGTYQASTPRAGMSVTLARPGPVELESIASSAGTDLQPRDRSRPANRHQEQKIAANWKPERAAAVPTTDSGPIIYSNNGQSFSNLSGHGRQNAQRILYTDPALKAKAQENREWIKAEMGRLGYTPEEIAAVDKMKMPVWAAEIVDLGDYASRFGDMETAGLAFVRDSNIYGMSPGELAISDAAILQRHKNGDLLMRLRVSDSGSYTLKQLGNDAILAEILELFGAGNEYTDTAGNLNQAFEDRLDNAMMAVALGNQSAETITGLVEGQDGTVNIRKALVTAAPELAKLSVAGAFDIGKEVIGPALQELAGFRAAKKAGTAQKLSDYLAQMDFTRVDDSRVTRILDAIADANRKPAQLGELLVEISRDELRKKLEADAYGDGLFGPMATPARLATPEASIQALATFAGENSKPAQAYRALLPLVPSMPDELKTAVAQAALYEEGRIRNGIFTAKDFHQQHGKRLEPLAMAVHRALDGATPEAAAKVPAIYAEFNRKIDRFLAARNVTGPLATPARVEIREHLLAVGQTQATAQAYFEFSPPPPARQTKPKRQTAAAEPQPENDPDVIAGLSGNKEAMARAVEKYGTVSSIIEKHVSGEIPSWNIRGMVIDTPADMHAALLGVRSPYFESLKVAVLDDNGKVVHSQIVTVGSINESIADPKGTFAALMRIRQSTGKKYNRIMLAHNHPSGHPSPSEHDRQMTNRMVKVAESLGFSVVDHVITNGESYYSFRESGVMYVNPTTLEKRRKVAETEKSLPTKSTPDMQPKADWETVPRSALPQILGDGPVEEHVNFLRQNNPKSGHIFFLSTRSTVLGIDRIENIVEKMATVEGRQEVFQRIAAGAARDGAFAIIMDLGDTRSVNKIALATIREVVPHVKNFAESIRLQFYDTVASSDSFGFVSGQAAGVMEMPDSAPLATPAKRKFFPGDYPATLEKTITSTTVSKLTAHPKYHEAKKEGSGIAAATIVDDLLKSEKVNELSALLAGRSAIFVPVMHRDTGNRANAIPMALADELAERLNGQVSEDIVKTSGSANTGVDVKARFQNAQEFDGPVVKGAYYVVVDDNHTSGDTLTALIDHIQGNGGIVIAATALAHSQSQNYLKPRPQDIAKLLDKAGISENEYEDEFGSIKRLTGSEAYRLANLVPGKGREWLRSRIPTSGSEANQSGSSIVQETAVGYDLFGNLFPEQPAVKPRARAADLAAKAPAKGKQAIAKQIATTEQFSPEAADLFGMAAAGLIDNSAKTPQTDKYGTGTNGQRNNRDAGGTGDLFDQSGQRDSGRPDQGQDGNQESDADGRDDAGDRAGDGSPGLLRKPDGSPEGNDQDGSTGTLRGEGGKNASSGPVTPPKINRPPPGDPERNAVIDPNRSYAPKAGRARFDANLKAIRLMRQIEDENRTATTEEKEQLLAYTGWGWLKEAFNKVRAGKYEAMLAEIRELYDYTLERYQNATGYYRPDNPGSWENYLADKLESRKNSRGKEAVATRRILSWADTYHEFYREIRDALTDEEFDAAAKSVRNAHYTDVPIIGAIWDLAAHLGFKGGRATEPGAGIGHFMGAMPAELADRTIWNAVELDTITARILSHLYPEANVNGESPRPGRKVAGLGWQSARIPNNSQDLVISNVPFAKEGPGQSAKEFGIDYNLHNYFFARAFSKAKPGGLVIFITSASTLDNNYDQRQALGKMADLVGAIRLPNTAFKANAGTEVTTDILVFRKPDGGPVNFTPQQWAYTTELEKTTITSRRPESAYSLKDWLSEIPSGWVPTDPDIAPLFEDWRRGKMPATGKKIDALHSAMRDKGMASALEFTAPVEANEYWKNNPSHAIGKHALAGSMYQADAYALVPDERAADIPAAMRDIIATFPRDVMGAQSGDSADTQTAATSDKMGSFVERDGKIWQVEPDGLVTPEWAGDPKKVIMFRSWANVRAKFTDLIALELAEASTDAQVDAARAALNTAYENHRIAFGALAQVRKNPLSFLQEDPDYIPLQALENIIEDTDKKGKRIYTYEKTDIFTKRAVKRRDPLKQADNLEEAILASMVVNGRLVPAQIAESLGKPLETIEAELLASPYAFQNPMTGVIEIADQYLSGNVGAKLAAAKMAMRDDPAMEKNVKALTDVQPAWQSIGQIGLSVKSVWIPPKVISEFADQVLGLQNTNVVRVEGTTYISANGNGSNDYRGGGWSALELLEAIVRDETIEVKVTEGKGADKRTFVDSQATAAAKAAAIRISEAFVTFAKTSEAQIENENGEQVAIPAMVEAAFNEKVSGWRPPSYNGEWITLPGQSGEIYLDRGFRKNVLARLLTLGYGMIAHGVGSGKTLTQVALAMELRRLGKAKKPVIIVEKSTLGQFAAAYRRAYPQAKLLVAGDTNFGPQDRARFLARMKTGDWDTVIMTRPQVSKIPHNQTTVQNFFARQLAALDAAIAASDDASDRQGAIQRRRDSLEEKMIKMQEKMAENQDRYGSTWEELGVDAIIIDEAHNYKNTSVITRRQNIKGLPTSVSQQAVGMELKTADVRARNSGKGVFMATGTPVSNTMGEAWIMLNFIAPGVLEENGITTFDEFADTYGDVVTNPEATWKGEVRDIARFAQFVNGRALIDVVRSVFDVAIGNAKLGLDVPRVKGGKPETIVLDETPAMQIMNDWVVGKLVPAYHDVFGEKDDEGQFIQQPMSGLRDYLEANKWVNAVPIMTMQAGIAAALDPRLIHDLAPDDPGSKVNQVVEQVYQRWLEGKDRKTAQVIFTDLAESFSMDHLINFVGEGPYDAFGETQGKFNLYEDIAAKLVAKGIPKEEIGWLPKQIDDDRKEKFFDKVNDGTIRVLIGGQRIATGVNFQERLAAAYHLMPPRDFKPAMMEQRNGRIIRQGNLHAEWAHDAYVEAAEAATGQKFTGKNAFARRKAAEKWMDKNNATDAKTKAEEAASKFDIVIIEYGMARSLDSAIYSTMSAKQGFIGQVLSGEVNGDFEDPTDQVAMDMAEMAAHTIGDPDLIRKIELDRAFRKLNQERQGFENRRAELLSNQRSANANIRYYEEQAVQMEKAAAELDGLFDKRKDDKGNSTPLYELESGETFDTTIKGGITAPINRWLLESRASSNSTIVRRSITVNGVKFDLAIETPLPGDEGVPVRITTGILSGWWNAQAKGASSLLMALRRAADFPAVRVDVAKQAVASNTRELADIERVLETYPAEYPQGQELAAIDAERTEVKSRITARKAAESQARRQRNESAPPPAAPLATPAKVDPRLAKVFGSNVQVDPVFGMPQIPRILSDQDSLLRHTNKLADVTVEKGDELSRLGILRPGTYPRKQMHDAIVRHILSQGKTIPDGMQPTVFFSGGGGGAGKTTILKDLKRKGLLQTRGAIEINSDDIKALIPEYDRIAQTGDGRAAFTVHEESSDIAKMVLEAVLKPSGVAGWGETAPAYNVIYDATLANFDKVVPILNRFKKAGFVTHLIGVTVDPMAGLIRAFIRGADSRRFVGADILMEAHIGFNRSLPGYIPLFDRVDLLDNTPPKPHPIGRKTLQKEFEITDQVWYDKIGERAQIQNPSPGNGYSEGLRPRLQGSPQERGRGRRQDQGQDEGLSRGEESQGVNAPLSTPARAGNFSNLREDLAAQRDYFRERMEDMGFKNEADIDEETFAKWAKEWREMNPRTAPDGAILYTPARIPPPPPTLPDAPLSRAVERLKDEDRFQKGFRQDELFQKYLAEEEAAEQANEAEWQKWVDSIPENRPITFSKQGRTGPAYYVVTKNTTRPDKPWRVTYWHTYPRPDWTADEEAEYEELFKKTRWVDSRNPEFQKWQDRLMELDSRKVPEGSTRIIPTGHEETKTRLEAVQHAIHMAGKESLETLTTEPLFTPRRVTPEAPDADLSKAALERALGELPPAMRRAWAELLKSKGNPETAAKATGLSVNAVENIIRIIRGRAIALDLAAKGQSVPTQDGKLFAGRPDLALSSNPVVAQVDAARNLEGSPSWRPRDIVIDEAKARLAADYNGTFNAMLEKARKTEPMSDTDVATVKLILAKETVSGALDNRARAMDLAELIYGYREIGSDTARSLAMRFDPHHNPADRAAQFLAEGFLSPDPSTRKMMKKAKTAAERQLLLQSWMNRVQGIRDAMKARGIDVQALLAQHAAVQQTIQQTDAANPAAARLYQIQIAKLSPQDRAILETARALQLAGQRDMRLVMARAAAAGAVDETYAVARYRKFQAELAAEMRAVAKQAAQVVLGTPGVTDAEMAILDDMGFGSLDEAYEEDNRPRKTPGKKKAPKVGKGSAAPAQEVNRPYVPVPGADPRTSPATQQPIPGLNGQPNEKTGDYDLTNPEVLNALAQALGGARGTWIDGLVEFWKASILSGPKTQIVNVVSTAAYGVYETTIRRAAEGVINDLLKLVGLGSKEAATTGELAVIFHHTRQAAGKAIRNGIYAWKTESRVFNDQALGLARQLDFATVKGEKAQRFQADPTTGLGKLVNLIMAIVRMPSFRLMGMTDEILKTFFGHLEAAAQSHRMAKAEGLKGEAYAARHAELMAYGSSAWVKAHDHALKVAFQTELGTGNDAVSRMIDPIAKIVQSGAQKVPVLQFIVPFITTPTNLAKNAITLSPAGLFFHAVDMVRALKTRYGDQEIPVEIRKAAAKEIYDRARLISDLTQQLLAWGLAYSLIGMAEDDDDEGLPSLTGSVPAKGTVQRGERDLAERTMPPYHIKLGGYWLDYSRLDPFSTVLAAIADYAHAKRQGKEGADLASHMAGKTLAAMKDKTFLSGISDLIHAYEDAVAAKSGGYGIQSYLARVATGFVPNLIRQPIQMADPMKRDTRELPADTGFLEGLAMRSGFMLIPQSAPVKLDVWGRPMPKTQAAILGEPGDALLRLTWPGGITANAAEKVLPIDKWILSYQRNRGEGDPTLAFEIPERNITYTIEGKRVTVSMSQEDHADFIQSAGKDALSALQGQSAAAWSDWKNPNAAKAKMVKDVMEDIRAGHRARMRAKYMPEALKKAGG